MLKFLIYFGVYLYTIWLHYVLGKDGSGRKDFVIAKLNIVIKIVLSCIIYISNVENKFVLFSVILPYLIPFTYKIEKCKGLNYADCNLINRKLLIIDILSMMLLVVVSIM